MMKTIVIALMACLAGLTPARAGVPQNYEDLLALTDPALKKDLLSPAQVKELKARLMGEIDAFHQIANVGYLNVYPRTAELEAKSYNPAGLSAMDQPYAIFTTVELAGRFNAASFYANGAGPGMKGILGDSSTRESRNAYWESLGKIESGVWVKHAQALTSAYWNAIVASNAEPKKKKAPKP